MKEKLVYLLIFLIPIQLGRHFIFNFSSIGGIPSDYLIPTLYLTDLIIFLLIFLDLNQSRLPRPDLIGTAMTLKQNKNFFIFFLYLFLSTVFIADNKWAAIYKTVKIIEFLWLFKILADLRLKTGYLLSAYSLAIIYSSIIAISQFLMQKSLGGLFWILGERAFYASTPGIALGSMGNRLFLRPYATFAHPNILGGFLAIGLPLIFLYLWKKRFPEKRMIVFVQKTLFTAAFILGSITLILTFSRSAWLIFLIGMVLINTAEIKKAREILAAYRDRYLIIFISLFVLSIILPLYILNTNLKNRSLFERKQLISSAISIIGKNPIFGTGLNNSISEQYETMTKKSGLFTHQPVHNVYLLVTSELGFVGLLFFLKFIKHTISKINKENVYYFLPFFMVLLLGFFDHYIFTLQQGNVIFVLFASIVFWPQKA